MIDTSIDDGRTFAPILCWCLGNVISQRHEEILFTFITNNTIVYIIIRIIVVDVDAETVIDFVVVALHDKRRIFCYTKKTDIILLVFTIW